MGSRPEKAGYATDPAYPSKLIKLIEDYRLYEYDKMKPEAFAQNNSSRKPEKGQVNAGETSSPIVMPAALTKTEASRKEGGEASYSGSYGGDGPDT